MARDKYISLFLGLPKTLFFNMKYFGLKDGIKLPILISNKVCLKSVKGKVNINSKIKFGMIHIGFGDIGIFDNKKSRSIWQVSGTVNFEGKANIGHGSKISVGGVLDIGNGCTITAETSIICKKKITIGRDTLLSWDILIMDSDQHNIFDFENNIINTDKEIVIGNNVWVACRNTILKGTIIPKNSVVAANSLLCNKFNKENTIIGGNPARIIKENVYWR